jgi:heme/copper-type cytochrome/quinol oxidase subunit 2
MKKISALIVVLLFALDTNAQCAMCKAVVENGGKEMAEGINSGITYLMLFPYLLVGLLAYVLFRYKKRAKN